MENNVTPGVSDPTPTTPAPAAAPTSIIQTIEVDGEKLIAFVNNVLPVLETAVPALAAAGGPVGLGVSAAAALLPLLEQIPIGPTYTVEMQQNILNRVQAITLLDFSGPQWKKSTDTQKA